MSSIFATKEAEALLRLFRNVETHYNAHSLSKELKLSSRGTLKLLKRLENQGLLISRTLGKATYYKPHLEDEYTRKLIELLLLGEAKVKASRYLFEFRDVLKHLQIAVLFGSILRTPKKANDIDLLAVFWQAQWQSVHDATDEIQEFSIRPLHLIKQSPEDFRKNLQKGDKVILNVLRYGVVLKGHEDFVKAVSEITRLP